MNWKLIFSLSLFGLAMAFATVYFIPSHTEPFFWLVIFIISAYCIAKYAPSKYFWHGLLVSLVNSLWITAVHIILFNDYIASHKQEAEMMAKIAMSFHPKLMMLVTGPVVGALSGFLLGFFSFLASRVVRKPA
ncbi:MAG: hypothetical protein K0R65_2522 [Crocinitomicaceae bacterium]|jgi:uncharacterized membrane protein|nr:hypothetical protein [Crocinitomicaceae bacterium]